MILLIDWGNTHLKFIEVDSLELPLLYQSKIYQVENVDELSKRLMAKNYEQVLVSSVRVTEDNQLLELLLKEKSTQVFFAKTAHSACGVKCAYAAPELLGIDRWLAILAAHDPKETVGVISLGTAITLDIVKPKAHVGGHILPGKRLLLSSLNTTGQVRPDLTVQKNYHAFQLGGSTTECVHNGIETLIHCYLNSVLEHYHIENSVKRWLLIGGGGKYWSNKFSSDLVKTEYCPYLVFDGLIRLYLE
ncbi:type III pantothenate kinase [Aliikangiella sp. IMCC44359]|uniref:type III pantothenate kinase n=1 Tax=Aliikangiella sp. IMCC44359 TaxID=3459125 RepID=UPI00403B0823